MGYGGVGRGTEKYRVVKLNLGGTNLLVPALPAVSHLWLESMVLLLESYIELEFMVLQLEYFMWEVILLYRELYQVILS